MTQLREGGLALIVRSKHGNVGKIVEVKRLCGMVPKGTRLRLPDGSFTVAKRDAALVMVESPHGLRLLNLRTRKIGVLKWAHLVASNLVPLPDLDEEDETTTEKELTT